MARIAAGQVVFVSNEDDTERIPVSLVQNGNIDSYGSAVISVAADQTDSSVIAAPGPLKQIWIFGIQTIVGANDTTLLLESASTALTGVVTYQKGGGVQKGLSGNFAMPYFKCGTNEAFTITNTVGTIRGDVQYAVVDVS